MDSVSSGEQNTYQLIYCGPANSEPDTLRKIKGTFIAKLKLSVEEVREILEHAPVVVQRGESEQDLADYRKLLEECGAEIQITSPSEFSDPVSESTAEEDNEDFDEEGFEIDFDMIAEEDEYRVAQNIYTLDESIDEEPEPESSLECTGEIDDLVAQLTSTSIITDPETSNQICPNIPLPSSERNTEQAPAPPPLLLEETELDFAEPRSSETAITPELNLSAEAKESANEDFDLSLRFDDEEIEPIIKEPAEEDEDIPLIDESLLKFSLSEEESAHAAIDERDEEMLLAKQEDSRSIESSSTPDLPAEQPIVRTKKLLVEENEEPLPAEQGREPKQKANSGSTEKLAAKIERVKPDSQVKAKTLVSKVGANKGKKARAFIGNEIVMSSSIGLLILVVGNFLYFGFHSPSSAIDASRQIQTAAESVRAAMTLQSTTPPSQSIKPRRYIGKKKYSDRTIYGAFRLEGINVKGIELIFTAPKQRERTPEEIVHNVKLPAVLHKLKATKFSIWHQDGGKFRAEGAGKVFLSVEGEKKTFSVNIIVKGVFVAETEQVKAVVEVQRGHFDYPLDGAVLIEPTKADFNFSMKGKVIASRDIDDLDF